jgi:hypothetical protein
MSDDLKVHDTTGNVFQDMGMRDADERLAKAELARLERFLNALDLEVRIQVGPRPAGKEHAGLNVLPPLPSSRTPTGMRLDPLHHRRTSAPAQLARVVPASRSTRLYAMIGQCQR